MPSTRSPRRDKNKSKTAACFSLIRGSVLGGLGASWRALGGSRGDLGTSWVALGSLLGRSWGCMGRSWRLLAALGSFLGCSANPKTTPRRPKTTPRRPQDCSLTVPRHPQDRRRCSKTLWDPKFSSNAVRVHVYATEKGLQHEPV